MSKSKKEARRKASKELIKTPTEKTILSTTVFIILLIFLFIIKNRTLACATIHYNNICGNSTVYNLFGSFGKISEFNKR